MSAVQLSLEYSWHVSWFEAVKMSWRLHNLILNSDEKLRSQSARVKHHSQKENVVICNIYLRHERQLNLPAGGKVPGFGCILWWVDCGFLFRTVLGVE